MRVLWVATRAPWPADDGAKLLTSATLGALAQRADVVAFVPESAGADETAARRAGVALKRLPFPGPNARRMKQLQAIFSLVPPSVAPFLGEYRSAALQAAGRVRADVVVADGLHVASVASDIAAVLGVPWVLRAHNVESLLARRHAGTAQGLRRALAWLEAPRLARFETTALEEAAHTFALSDDDARGLLELSPGARVSVVPAAYLAPANALKAGPDVASAVFVGDLAWQPNVEAVRWLVKEIWPQVHALRPDATLRIVGKRPSGAVRDAVASSSVPGVVLVGPVPSVTPELQRARLSVVPLRAGSGVRLKILEAFAHGRPVVSTTIGAEGLPGLSEAPITLADEASAFAAAVVRSLGDAGLSVSARVDGPAWVQRQAGPGVMAERLLAGLDGVVSGKVRRSA